MSPYIRIADVIPPQTPSSYTTILQYYYATILLYCHTTILLYCHTTILLYQGTLHYRLSHLGIIAGRYSTGSRYIVRSDSVDMNSQASFDRALTRKPGRMSETITGYWGEVISQCDVIVRKTQLIPAGRMPLRECIMAV